MTGLGPQQLGPMLLGSYLVVGLVMAAWLQRAGHERGPVLGALIAWPMLLPLLQQPAPAPVAASGPFRDRIDAVLRALLLTLGDPAAAGVPWSADLDGLRGALHAADARLGLVDRLLDDGALGSEAAVVEGVARLQAARERSVRELEAVLSEVVQLRLQVGVAALAGGGDSLAGRLRDLSHRAAALHELTECETG